jgi:enoyl-CoA hydratase
LSKGTKEGHLLSKVFRKANTVESIMQYLSFDVKNNIGIITLNRPKALNALTLDMIRSLYAKLKDWETQPDIHQVFILSHSDKAFCAGGDIRHVYTAHQKGDKSISHYFKEEYDLNKTIKYYPKPYIAIINGITMGGGLGISIQATLKIALNNLILAMPETGIGFFPDVGSTYFLSRCPGQIGIYCGLTGARLNATEALYAGLIDQIVGEPPIINSLETHRDIINHCFQYSTLEEILTSLSKENKSFAKEVHDLILTKSPTSLKITLQALRQAATLDFDDCMAMEYKLACYCAENHDFYEGIRAAIIDKDYHPKWQPASLAEVDEKAIDLMIAHE